MRRLLLPGPEVSGFRFKTLPDIGRSITYCLSRIMVCRSKNPRQVGRLHVAQDFHRSDSLVFVSGIPGMQCQGFGCR